MSDFYRMLPGERRTFEVSHDDDDMTQALGEYFLRKARILGETVGSFQLTAGRLEQTPVGLRAYFEVTLIGKEDKD